MELKEMAKAFDMNVNEFSWMSGYTSQGLKIMDSPNEQKITVFIKRLRERNEMLYKKDVEYLRRRQRKRQEIIDYYTNKLERKRGKNDN